MASLTGQLVAETYKALLKTIDNDILTASEKQITDGLGGGSNVFIDSQGFLRAYKYKVTNGLATQFLKADGSLDANTYLTSITGAQVITALGFTPVTNARTLTINGTTYDLTANRSWTVAGTAAVWGNITGTLSNQTDLQAALNAKFNNPTGTISQYIRGDGSIATFPTSGGGGGGGVSYYLNGSINQGTIGGVTYYEMNKVPIIGTGTDFSRNSNGYIASFLTDANDPALLQIPAGNWNFETYLQASNGGGSPSFYIELYKYDGTTFTLIASNSGTPKLINDGANIEAYFSALAVPQTTLTLTDRLAIRIYVNTAGRTITLHTENGHLCEVATTFSTGISALNGLTAQIQYFATGTSGTDFNISSSTATHTFNLPTASAVNRGALSAADWTTFNAKQAQLDGTGFVKASGTTISYDNSTYLTTADAASTYQLLTNLSTDLTASATKYPSVNAVIAGLNLKLNLTGGTLTGSITATSFVKEGGTSVQYLKADGSVAEITGDIVSGAGSAGYVPKWTSAIVLGSSILFDNGTSMAIGSTNVNYHAYGRSLTGSGFGSTSFGFEAVTGSTTNGALIGGLSLVIASNDSTRRIGSAIQSYISGATSTHQGADLRFFVKPDNAVLLEVVRMTSAGITFNKDLTAANITATTFVKSGGLSTQFLMADGSVSTLSSPVTGSGSAGYIPKWTTAANIGSSIIYEDTSIGIAYTTPNRGGYGRTLSGASFGSASFGFEAVSNTTTNGGLIGGLSFIVNQNDSSRIVGSAIQSNLVGTTATNYGADLRFFAKADGVFTIAEVARMTSAGLRVYGTIVKDGGTSSQVLMADGSVSAFPSLSGYLQLAGGTMTGQLNLWAEQYQTAPTPSYGINAQNSDIIGLNALYYNDNADSSGEGINFWRSAGYWDTLRAESGVLYFAPNRATASAMTGFTVYHSGNLVNPTTGSGTSGYLPKYTGSTTLGNSQIFDTGTNVGINNASPTSKFVVSGSHTSGRGLIEMFSSDDCLIALKKGSATSGLRFQNLAGTDNWFFGDLTAGDIVLQENFSTTRFTMFKGGNFVIGNGADAGYKLDVNGSFRANSLRTESSGLSLTSVNTSTFYYMKYNTDGFDSYTNTNGSAPIYIKTGGSTRLTIADTGAATFSSNLGVGGQNPRTGSGVKSIESTNYVIEDNGDFGIKSNAYYNGTNNIYINNGYANRIYLGSGTYTYYDAPNGSANNIVSFTPRFYIANGGNVGIGTTLPAVRLGGKVLSINDTGSALQSSIELLRNGNSSGEIFVNSDNMVIGSFESSIPIVFRTQNQNRLTITSNGEVGIGVVPSSGNRFWVKGNDSTASNTSIIAQNSSGLITFLVRNDGSSYFQGGNLAVGGTSADVRLHVTGIPNTNGDAVYNLILQDPSSVASRLGSGISFGGNYDTSLSSFTFANIKGYKENTTNGDYAGALAFSTRINGGSPTVRMLINSAGRVLIGTGSINGLLQLTGSHPSGFGMLNMNSTNACIVSLDSSSVYDVRIRYKYQGTDFWFTGMVDNSTYKWESQSGVVMSLTQAGNLTATAFFESSDMRLKKLIDGSGQIAGIENLQAKLYEKNGKTEFGYFAQDAEKYMPYAVSKGDGGFLSLSYREVHTAKIARLEKRVAELEKQLNLN